MNISHTFAQTSNKVVFALEESQYNLTSCLLAKVKENSVMEKKRILLTLALLCTLLCFGGCGRRMNSATDGTDKNNTMENDTNSHSHENGTPAEDVTDGVEDMVDGVMDGVDDVVNGTEQDTDRTTNDGNVNDNVLPDNQDNTVNDQHNYNNSH